MENSLKQFLNLLDLIILKQIASTFASVEISRDYDCAQAIEAFTARCHPFSNSFTLLVSIAEKMFYPPAIVVVSLQYFSNNQQQDRQDRQRQVPLFL